MRARKPTVLLAVTTALHLSLLGCMELRHADDAGTGCPSQDLSSPLPDLATTAPKCAAAKGLPGDNLLCVDFDKITQLNDPALAGWNFNANTPGCWQISGGYLQVQNFGTFSGYCGAILPSLDFKQPDKNTYQKATLSITHRIDLSDVDQQIAQIYLDTASPSRSVHALTGRSSIPSFVTTSITINKSDLPGSLMNVFKFYISAYSPSAIGGRQGWQIQSISINGSL